MKEKVRFQFGFDSGQIFQHAFFVKDIDVAMQYYVNHLGIGPFTCNRGWVSPKGVYRGSTDNPTLSMAHAFSGHYYVELVQQHNDKPSMYKEFYDSYGYGLHHFGFILTADDYDEKLAGFQGQGMEVIFTGVPSLGAITCMLSPKEAEARDYQRNSIGAPNLELIQVAGRTEEFFLGLQKAHDDWDGDSIEMQDPLK